MDWFPITKVPENSPRRTPTRVPPISKAGVDSQSKHTFQKAQPKKVPLKEILRSGERLNTIYLNSKLDESLVFECNGKKEKLWLSDVYNRVESVARAMEKEKRELKRKELLSIGPSTCNLLGFSTIRDPEKSWIPKTQNGNIYEDWRGRVIADTTVPYTMLSKEEHEARLVEITRRKRFKQPPVGLNDHRGPRLPAPEKQGCAAAHHVSTVGPHSTSLQLGRMSGPPSDANMYSPGQFQPGFISSRHSGPPMRQGETSELPPGHIYRSYKYPAVWNRNHDAGNQIALGIDKKSPVGPCSPILPHALSHIMDPRTVRQPLSPNQWPEQSNFLPHGIPPSGYIRHPGKASSQRIQQQLPASLFGSISQIHRGAQSGDSMMDSPEMIAMQQLSSRVCPPGVPYHPHQPPSSHLSGPFPQLTHAATANIQLPKPVLRNGNSEDGSQTINSENNQAAAPRSTWVKPIVDGEDSYMFLARGHPVLKSADIRIAGALVATAIRERKKKEQMEQEETHMLEESD